MRRVLLIAFVTLVINIGTNGSATASEILFLAPQFPCFGVPLMCFPGGPGFPVEYGGANYVPIDIPANSLIEEIDLWGSGARAVGIWDSTTHPPPFQPVIPGHELAAIAPDSIDVMSTLFAVDGANGSPYFFFQGTLHTPIFLQDGGRYYVGVGGFELVGASDVIWNVPSFMADVDPSGISGRYPGLSIQVVGQVVPEPSTIALVALGLMLLCLRRGDRFHLPHR